MKFEVFLGGPFNPNHPDSPTREEILTQLEPVRGVKVKIGGKEVDSADLLAKAEDRPSALTALFLASAEGGGSPPVGLRNNLACAYAWAGNLAAATKYLQGIIEELEAAAKEPAPVEGPAPDPESNAGDLLELARGNLKVVQQAAGVE